jgi:hypothetical protein
MGAFDQIDDTITIHSDKWDAHEQVTARAVATVADEEWVNNQVLIMKKAEKKNKGLDFDSQLGATRRLWLERMIVSWTFTKNGQPVPVSKAAINKLPSKYADYIYEQINAANEDPDEEEDGGDGQEGKGQDFMSGAELTTSAPANVNYLTRL